MMRFVEFVNFDEDEMVKMRKLFRESDATERWVEWRSGLKSIVPEPDISLINMKGVTNPWVAKKLTDVCSAKYAAVYGVKAEILGLPLVSEANPISSLAAQMKTNQVIRSTLSAATAGYELTCPTPLSTSQSAWGDLCSMQAIPRYA